jgi:hypothetical protein
LEELGDYQLELESLVNETVRSCDNLNEWEEDHITLQIIRNLHKKVSHASQLVAEHELKVEWSAYRQKKKSWGDLGVLVNIRYSDGSELKGGAILEAKKRARSSIGFDAIKSIQLDSVETNARHAMLLLYDYDKITHFALEPFLGDLRRPYRPAPLTTFTHAAVSPISIARKTGWRDQSLYRSCLPFSYQLCFRYFSGLDLDVDQGLIEVLEGRAALGSPKYLLVFSIARGNVEPNAGIRPDHNSYSTWEDRLD